MIPIQQALKEWADALHAAAEAGIVTDNYARAIWNDTGATALEEARCASPVELDFLREMRMDRSLDRFKPNVEVMGGRYRIDFADIHTLIGVEIDGYAYHSDKDTFVNDRQRQRALEQDGWRLIRFAGVEVHHDAAGSVEAFKRWLAAVAPPPVATLSPAPVNPATGRAILGGRARRPAS